MNKELKWYQKGNHPMALIFYILIIATILTYLVPAGEYTRTVVDGRTIVDPSSYAKVAQTPVSAFDAIVAIPEGLVQAGIYLFIVFIAGGLFELLSHSGAVENTIGTAVKKAGSSKRNLVIFLATYLYGLLGLSIGYENNIALVPVAVLIASAFGLSNVIGACIAIGGVGVGFALSPINPYTVGTAQGIAELPLFSGALLRTVLVFTALTALAFYITRVLAPKHPAGTNDEIGLTKPLNEYSMKGRDWLITSIFIGSIFIIALCSYLSGVKTEDGGNALGRSWYINEISAVFIIDAIIIAAICGYTPNKFIEIMIAGASKVTGGALVIGLAASIKVVLIDGHIIDTIIYNLSGLLDGLPTSFTAVMMTVTQGVLNLFIPSGSGQAFATMPILIPVADLIGMTRQLMILSFQVGDGITNLIVPTSGGTLAMLAIARVPYSQWLKVIFPFIVFVYILSWAFIVFAYYTGWH